MAIDLTVTVRRVWLPLPECLTVSHLRQPARGRYPRLFIDRGEKRREALHDIPDRSRSIARRASAVPRVPDCNLWLKPLDGQCICIGHRMDDG